MYIYKSQALVLSRKVIQVGNFVPFHTEWSLSQSNKRRELFDILSLTADSPNHFINVQCLWGGKLCASRSNMYSTWYREFTWRLIVDIYDYIVNLFIFVCTYVLICEIWTYHSQKKVNGFIPYKLWVLLKHGASTLIHGVPITIVWFCALIFVVVLIAIPAMT